MVLRLPTQILARITYSRDYNRDDFYIFVCEYEAGNEEQTEIIAHGSDSKWVGWKLSEIEYSQNAHGDKNKEIGRKLARQEVML